MKKNVYLYLYLQDILILYAEAEQYFVQTRNISPYREKSDS